MSARSGVFRFSMAAIALVVLSGCFESAQLFKEQRIWDSAWEGRYQSGDVEYVVLAQDEEAHTYLLGSRKAGEDGVSVFRAALYPGWDDFFILGTQQLPEPNEKAVYYPLRRVSANALEVVNLLCGEAAADEKQRTKKKQKQKQTAESKDPTDCNFQTIDALRQELAKELAAQKAKTKTYASKKVASISRVPAKPLGGIGAATEFGTFEDHDGVHGALRVKALSPGSPAAAAGVRVGELIIAVDGGGSLTARALTVFIAFAKPGQTLRLALYDPATKAARDVEVVAVARSGS